MDAMETRSKMAASVFLVATGAFLGACFVYLFTRRTKRKPDDSAAEQNDAVARVSAELDDCRKSLDELRTRLEHEAERREESETWNRKLEEDLVDLAGARKEAENNCARLQREVQELSEQLRDSVAEVDSLRQQLIECKHSAKYNTSHTAMPSLKQEASEFIQSAPPSSRPQHGVNARGSDMQTCEEHISPLLSNGCQATANRNEPETVYRDAKRSTAMEDRPKGPVQCERDSGLPSQQCGQCDDLEAEYDEDDYSDEEEEEENEDESISIINSSIVSSTDDNFELGKDVMGALIANAFKDGVIEREGDDTGISEGTSVDSQPVPCRIPPKRANGHLSKEKGEISQESIGDTKTTRQFWEQIIAADKHYVQDDVSYDDDDIIDDVDDLSDDEYDDIESIDDKDFSPKGAIRPLNHLQEEGKSNHHLRETTFDIIDSTQQQSDK